MTEANQQEYPSIPISTILICALAMALGWLVYGNRPFPEAAALPGALAGLCISLCFGREDWQKRWRDFALFGAIGWGLGGMMPLQHLAGYTNTGAQYWWNMLYGTAGLSLVGLIWAGVGGFFTALPALLKPDDLRSCRQAAIVFIVLWLLTKLLLFFNIPPQDQLEIWVRHYFYEENPANGGALLYAFAWFQFHGISLLLPVLMLCYCCMRFMTRQNSSLGFLLSCLMVFGWFTGVSLFVGGFGYRLNPPQSDAWAGLLGVLIALLAALIGNRKFNSLPEFRSIMFLTVVTAFWGALAVPMANTFRLYVYCQNALYPSEQIMWLAQGLINGLGLCIALSYAAAFLSFDNHDSRKMHWKSPSLFMAVVFVFTGSVVYRVVLSDWAQENLIVLFPADVHLAGWIALALLGMWLTLSAVLWVKKDMMIPALPVVDEMLGRWLCLGLVWMTVVLFLIQNTVFNHNVWLNILCWMAACFLTIRGLIAPEPLPVPKTENPWQQDVKRRTVQHVLSWVIITTVFIFALTAFHANLILYPTKGHYFRFGPNAWYPGIDSFVYADERESG